MKFSYQPRLKKVAAKLRDESTLSEILVWQHLKGRQRSGFKFQRQRIIDSYILDFFSAELMLAVEIDGRSHKLKEREDAIRQRCLEKVGIRFLRFGDWEVKRNLQGVVAAIDAWIARNETGNPTHPGLRPPLFIEGSGADRDL